MKELPSRLTYKTLAQAVIVWFVCLVLAMMVLDGGFILGFYLIASLLFWVGSIIYFRSRRFYWPGDLWAFRLGPFVLLVLGFVGGTALILLGKQ